MFTDNLIDVKITKYVYVVFSEVAVIWEIEKSVLSNQMLTSTFLNFFINKLILLSLSFVCPWPVI